MILKRMMRIDFMGFAHFEKRIRHIVENINADVRKKRGVEITSSLV
jgi:hypothetical protein